MDTILVIIAAVIIIMIIVSVARRRRSRPVYSEETRLPPSYSYTRREYIMTRAEQAFYRRLFAICGREYLIYPQVHLSTLLDHRSRGQDWRAALSKIQRKSVDYVLCTPDFKIIAAIELDDSTHDHESRRERDEFVDEICSQSGLPLIRVRTPAQLSDEELREAIQQAVGQVS